MPTTPIPDGHDRDDTLRRLAGLLRRRLDVIGDTAWRDRDPDGHLAALREVSEAVGALHLEQGDGLPPRLQHFLERASFDKALAYIEAR